MAPIAIFTGMIKELLILMVTFADVNKQFQSSDIAEELRKYEKLRQHDLPRHQRKISRSLVHQDTEQRPTILPRTRRVLLMQDGKYATCDHFDPR
jgi:hypothetical protein